MRQGGPSLKAAVWESAVLRIWWSTVAMKSTTVCAVMLTSKSDWLEKCDVSAPADALMHLSWFKDVNVLLNLPTSSSQRLVKQCRSSAPWRCNICR